MKTKILILLVLALLIPFLAGCPKQTLKPESALDTPEYHYNLGMKLLEQENYADALASFKRAIALDPKYVNAYVGAALANLGLGNLTEAESMAKKAVNMDGNNEKARIALGRVYTEMGKIKDAIGEFNEAISINPKSADAYYYMGLAYKKGDKYDKAEQSFKKALEIDPGYAKANAEWEKLQDITRAMTGMPKEYMAIAKSDAISKADIAALFINELNLEKLLKKEVSDEPPKYVPPADLMGKTKTEGGKDIPPDIVNHWARFYIEKAIDLGIMEAYANENFGPDDKITKAEYAMLIETLLAKIRGSDKIQTKMIGSESAFTDVRNDHFAYNAICLVTQMGIMQPKDKLKGIFGLMDPVPGKDAILIIKELKKVINE